LKMISKMILPRKKQLRITRMANKKVTMPKVTNNDPIAFNL